MTASDPNVRQSVIVSTASAIWMRGLYMLVFMFLLSIVYSVLWATMLIQFNWLCRKFLPPRGSFVTN